MEKHNRGLIGKFGESSLASRVDVFDASCVWVSKARSCARVSETLGDGVHKEGTNELTQAPRRIPPL